MQDATMQDATMNDGVLGSSSEIENEIVMRVRAKFLEMGHYFFWGSAKIRAKSILNTTKSIAEKEIISSFHNSSLNKLIEIIFILSN